MLRTVKEGGWYGDITIEGDIVTLYRDSHIEVNGNRVELPISSFGKENILQLVCKRWNGQVLIAGQGQYTGNWFYRDGKWKIVSTSFGTFACAFSSNALYLVIDNNLYCLLDLASGLMGRTIVRSIGVNGIRYIDFSQSPDGIVTGDATYGPNPYNLSQWTMQSDYMYGQSNVVVGQSYIDGAIALYKERYLIEKGDTQFIRFHREGNVLTIAIVKMLELKTVYYQMITEELVQFPIEGQPEKPHLPPINNMPKSDEQLRADQDELVRFYMDPDGLNRRNRGIAEPIIYHDKAILNWFNMVFSQPVEYVKNEIKKYPEYKEQHPNENPH